MKKLMTLMSIVLIMLSVSTPSAIAKDAKKEAVAVFTVSPAMSCQNCENKIKNNLRFEKGVNEVITDLKAQTVTVKYTEGKTTPEAIEKALNKIGYSASPACCGEKKCEKACDGEKKCCGEKKAECGKACGDKKCEKACNGEKKCCGEKKSECTRAIGSVCK